MPTNSCFVISPIGGEGTEIRKHADQVLRYIVEPAMEELKIKAVRSDQLAEPGRISEQMFREIVHNDLCVAILTFFNPNVFYELAVAQCASRPVVILLAKGERLPFDVQDLRIIPYDLDLDAIARGESKQALIDQVREVLNPDWEPVNPLALSDGEWTPEQLKRIEKLIETTRPAVLPPSVNAVYALPNDPMRRIVLRTGGVEHVRGVDVLVSSENTDFQLSRYFEPSMSGSLRYLDAQKDPGGAVIRDSLNEALQGEIDRLNIRLPVVPGTVVATPTDGLRKLGARYVFHTAAVRGEVGHGYVPVSDRIDACVNNAFDRFAELAAEGPDNGEPLGSILFPILGAGSAKLDPLEAVRRMFPYILNKMESVVACREAHLLARVESHRRATAEVAAEHGLEKV